MSDLIIIGPVSDLGPNGYSPSSGLSHFAMVDEDPHDSDTTYLNTNASLREEWGIDVGLLPAGAIITNVTVRVVQKRSTAGANSYLAGLTKSGTDYPGALHSFGSGSTFATTEDDFAVDPDDLQPWTVARLALYRLYHAQQSQAVGLPRPRLTECVLIVTFEAPTSRPEASAEAQPIVAAGTAVNGCVATAAPGGPTATAASLSAEATAAPARPVAEGD